MAYHHHQRYIPQGPPPMQPLLAEGNEEVEELYDQYQDQVIPHSQGATHASAYTPGHDYDHRREYAQPPPSAAAQPQQYHGTYRTPVNNYPQPNPSHTPIHDSPHYPSATIIPKHPSPPPPAISSQPPNPPPPSTSEMPLPHQTVETGQYPPLPPSTSYYPASTFGNLPRPPAGASVNYADQDGKWQTYPADQQGLGANGGVNPGGFGAIMGQTYNGIDDGNLNSLSDAPPDASGNPSKPPYPYTTIIRYAIQGSPRNKLTLSELYASMEARFPWYKSTEAGNGWRVSLSPRPVYFPASD